MKRTILILGGGFGGVYTAVYLEKLMTAAERKANEIVIVSRDNYIVFQPLLPEVISGSVQLNHVISPIRRLARTALLYTREVEAIDLGKCTVKLSPGAKPTASVITYDHLVIALGTRLDHSKIPGMREHACPFKYLGDALYLRNQLVRVLEEAEAESDPKLRRALLTFVVAGGGFSGVECIAEMNDFLREAVQSYHQISEKDLRLILLQRGDRILPELTEGLSEFASRLLMRRGVEIQFGTSLKAVSADAVAIEIASSQQTRVIETRTTVATVPAGPHPLLSMLPLPQERGRIKVDEGMGVPEAPNVWALGDCPFAYVLFSVAELSSSTAVEQILGRIMRMPKAIRKQREALNCSYAYVASSKFDEASRALKDGLVSAGFEKQEVEDLVVTSELLPSTIGSGRLCARQTSRRQLFTTYGSTCPETGQDVRSKYSGFHARRTQAGFHFHGSGENGFLGPPFCGRGNLRHTAQGTGCLDAVARCLRDEVSRI